MFKINEKFESIWQAFKSDNIEIADFSSAGINFLIIQNWVMMVYYVQEI